LVTLSELRDAKTTEYVSSQAAQKAVCRGRRREKAGGVAWRYVERIERSENDGGDVKESAGCSNRSSSEAAADESTGGVAPGYVEDGFEGRTKLGTCFSSPP